MDASENGNGAGGGTELKPLPDARVYRMRLKQEFEEGQKIKRLAYYDDSLEHGLVGIGWCDWVSPDFLDGLPSEVGEVLLGAIKNGQALAWPGHQGPLGKFAPDRVAVLQLDGLSREQAVAFAKAWQDRNLHSEQPKSGHQVSTFLTARPGDLIMFCKGDVYSIGRFSQTVSSLEGKKFNQLKAFGTAGHVCRPVVWVEPSLSKALAAAWLENNGFASQRAIIDKPIVTYTIEAMAPEVGGKSYQATFLPDPEGKGPGGKKVEKIEKIEKNMKPNVYAVRDLLQRSKTIILEGVPGTGKTYAIKNDICNLWAGAGQKRELGGQGDGHYAITLHPATSYEDFVEGLRPVVGQERVDSVRQGPRKAADAKAVLYRHDGEEPELLSGAKLENHSFFHVKLAGIRDNDVRFAVQDGFFLRVCAVAVNNPDKDYVVLLDEFNRCNVPKVMGDLLTTIERSKRAEWTSKNGKEAWDLSRCQVVTLPVSKRLFFVPENVYVVATMNSTDRSVAPLDSALRRRFAFHRCWPMGFDPQNNRTDEADEGNKNEPTDEKAKVEKAKVEKVKVEKARVEKVDRVVTEAENKIGKDKLPIDVFKASVEAWVRINTLLLKAGGPDALLGHSYLMDLADDLGKLSGVEKDGATPHLWVEHHWNHHILPQLADVLITHTLESLLETKAAEAGEILKIKVGERRIVQPTATTRESRGQYGTLVLRLEESSEQADAPKVATLLKTGDNKSTSGDGLPRLLTLEECVGTGAGIYFRTGNLEQWATRRNGAIEALKTAFFDNEAPMPARFYESPNGKIDRTKAPIAEIREHGDVENCWTQFQPHQGSPFACCFENADGAAVDALLGKLKEAGSSSITK